MSNSTSTVLLLWKSGRQEAHLPHHLFPDCLGDLPSTLTISLFQLVQPPGEVELQETLPIVKWKVEFVKVENTSSGQVCYKENCTTWEVANALH